MTCRTRLLTFYWQRLGYENHSLSAERRDASGPTSSNPPEELERVGTVEPSERTEQTQDSTNECVGKT
jgi:hypothetical protein